MKAHARDRPNPVAAGAIIVATASAYVIRMNLFDHGILGIAATPVVIGLLLLAGAIGTMEATASPGNPLPGMVGPLACAYLLFQWFLSRVPDGWFVASIGFPLACLLAYASCAGLCLWVASIRRALGVPRVVVLSAVGCCAGPLLLLESGANGSELIRERVPPRNPLSVWLFIACVFVLIAAATVARRDLSNDTGAIKRLRFAGVFVGVVAVVVIFSVQLRILLPGPGSAHLLGGLTLLLVAAVILHSANVAKRMASTAGPDDAP